MRKKLDWSVALTMVVVAVLGVLSLAAAVDAQQEKITIRMWHHESPAHRVAAFEKVIRLFEKEYPHIDVVQQVITWADAWPTTLSAIAAGNPPDFQFSLPDLTVTMYKADALVPVTDLVEELHQTWGFVGDIQKMYYHEGEYWGVPVWTMPMALIYRPSYFEEYVGTSEPPQSWAELAEYAERLTVDKDGDGRIDIYGIGLGASIDLMTQEQAYVFMASNGATLFDENGEVNFDSPKTMEALNFYKELFQYANPAATGWSWGEIELNFASGNIAMLPYFAGLQKRFTELGNMDLAAAPFPAPGGGPGGTISYPNDIAIFKQAAERGHLEAVYEFIRFVMRPDINAIITAEGEPGSFVPVTQAAITAPEYWNDPVISTFPEVNQVIVDVLPYGRLYGFEHDRWVNLGIAEIAGANILAEVVQRAVTETMSVEEAVRWGAQEMRRLAQ